MKKHVLTICLALILILTGVMIFSVIKSKALSAVITYNPYDPATLSTSEIISKYHKNINAAFNNYTKLMIKGQKDPSDPNGKALTASECFVHPENYSTYCVAVNLLGANSNECVNKDNAPQDLQLPEDYKVFCELGETALAQQGYLNFKASLEKKRDLALDSAANKNTADLALESITSITANLAIRQRNIDDEIPAAKEALDQTLSAYDQLRTAWPMHQQYKEIYKNLETYRDDLVNVRQQTDTFPSKFIDVTTTQCK